MLNSLRVTNGFIGQVRRFGTVGALGFLVDAGLLVALISLGSDPYLARAVSFPVAVTVTWYLNRTWTFAAQPPSLGRRRQYARYFAVQTVGGLSNYACYAAVLIFVQESAPGALFALAVGAVAGLIVNFLGARVFVFTSIDLDLMRSGHVRRRHQV